MARFGIPNWTELPKKLQILLFSSFLIPLGSFMVLPFIPIFLSERAGLRLEVVGLVLGLSSLIQFGGGLIGGIVADRFGLKPTMILALSIRTAGFAFLTISHWLPAAMLPAILIIATGAALYLPANKAYIVDSVDQEERAIFLSLSNALLNAGMGLGPLIGGLFILGHSVVLFSGVSLCFLFLVPLHVKLTPQTQPVSVKGHAFKLSGLIKNFKTAAFPLLVNAISIYIYFFFQNYMGPYTSRLFSPEIYSIILIINSALIFFIQPLMANWIKRIDYTALLSASFLLMMAGMIAIAKGSLVALVIGTILISLAEIQLFLKNDLEIVEKLRANPAIAFGLQRLTAGLGTFSSGVLGGLLLGVARDHWQNSALFWICVATQSLVLAAIALLIHVKKIPCFDSK